MRPKTVVRLKAMLWPKAVMRLKTNNCKIFLLFLLMMAMPSL